MRSISWITGSDCSAALQIHSPPTMRTTSRRTLSSSSFAASSKSARASFSMIRIRLVSHIRSRAARRSSLVLAERAADARQLRRRHPRAPSGRRACGALAGGLLTAEDPEEVSRLLGSGRVLGGEELGWSRAISSSFSSLAPHGDAADRVGLLGFIAMSTSASRIARGLVVHDGESEVDRVAQRVVLLHLGPRDPRRGTSARWRPPAGGACPTRSGCRTRAGRRACASSFASGRCAPERCRPRRRVPRGIDRRGSDRGPVRPRRRRGSRPRSRAWRAGSPGPSWMREHRRRDRRRQRGAQEDSAGQWTGTMSARMPQRLRRGQRQRPLTGDSVRTGRTCSLLALVGSAHTGGAPRADAR